MARLLWALTCQRAIIDRETNTASYIDAVEQVQVQGFPAVFVPPLCVASLWKRDRDSDEVLNLRIRLLAPSGQEVTSFRPDEVRMTSPRYRMNVMFSGFPIKEEGEYSFEIDLLAGKSWKVVCSLPITVELLSAESRHGSPEGGPSKKRSSNG